MDKASQTSYGESGSSNHHSSSHVVHAFGTNNPADEESKLKNRRDCVGRCVQRGASLGASTYSHLASSGQLASLILEQQEERLADEDREDDEGGEESRDETSLCLVGCDVRCIVDSEAELVRAGLSIKSPGYLKGLELASHRKQ